MIISILLLLISPIVAVYNIDFAIALLVIAWLVGITLSELSEEE